MKVNCTFLFDGPLLEPMNRILSGGSSLKTSYLKYLFNYLGRVWIHVSLFLVRVSEKSHSHFPFVDGGMRE